jgi:hypothetical protein
MVMHPSHGGIGFTGVSCFLLWSMFPIILCLRFPYAHLFDLIYKTMTDIFKARASSQMET